MITRSYSELRRLESFEERFEYLVLRGMVGDPTFGYDRHINQKFYTSYEWRHVRDHVIVRDNGCDLGVYGYDVFEDLVVHHMNPMTVDDIVHGESWILDPEYLITTTLDTHNAIHYGAEPRTRKTYTPRAPGDTKLWGR